MNKSFFLIIEFKNENFHNCSKIALFPFYNQITINYLKFFFELKRKYIRINNLQYNLQNYKLIIF